MHNTSHNPQRNSLRRSCRTFGARFATPMALVVSWSSVLAGVWTAASAQQPSQVSKPVSSGTQVSSDTEAISSGQSSSAQSSSVERRASKPQSVLAGVFNIVQSGAGVADAAAGPPRVLQQLDSQFVSAHLKQLVLLVTTRSPAALSSDTADSTLQQPAELRALRTLYFEPVESASTEPSDAARTSEIRAFVGPTLQQEPPAKDSPDDRWWKLATSTFTPSSGEGGTLPQSMEYISSEDGASSVAAPWQQVVGTSKEWRNACRQHLRAASIFQSLEGGEPPAALTPTELHEIGISHPPVLGASVLEIAGWLEVVDAQQASRRVAGDIEVADRLRADLRAYLQALRVPSLVVLLDERIPIGSRALTTLTMHSTWESDAWPLLQASIDALKNREDARARFAQLALRVGTKVGFSKEAILWLQNRLDRVAKNLPSNFQWDAAFEEAVSQHLEDAFQVGAMFDGAYRAPGFDVNDLLICRIYAQTAAFEVFGYAWSREGALSPSQQAARAQQFESLISPIRQAAEEDRFVVAQYDFAELASARIYDHFARDTANWKPWLVFPMRDPSLVSAVVSEWLINIQGDVDEFRRDFAYTPNFPHRHGLNHADVDWAIDGVFGLADRPGDGLPWVMDDLQSLFWDGYVALRR